MKEARLYDKLEGEEVKCRLCRHGCKIRDDHRGLCAVRLNQGGTLYTLVYNRVVSTNVDPIEKKPFFHFVPGTKSFSIATVGCNFFCSFCQNYSISQMPRDMNRIMGEEYSPREIVDMALSTGCKSIAYTYTEPTIFYELARDTMTEARKSGLLNVFVTNGFMTREMLDDCRGLMDAANVDLKAFTEKFYKRHCKARLDGVLDTLKYMKQLGIWLEVTTLLIPTLNDSMDEVRELIRFIRDELGASTPWHVSRFFPQYKEKSLPPTAVEALRKVRQMGIEEGLEYVYTGNVPWDEGEKTYCPSCSTTLIDRVGYHIENDILKDGCCPKCGHKVDGVWL
jgi:pyruvate formate lyase activating enzyme